MEYIPTGGVFVTGAYGDSRWEVEGELGPSWRNGRLGLGRARGGDCGGGSGTGDGWGGKGDGCGGGGGTKRTVCA